MEGFIVIDGDPVYFMPAFPPAAVVPQPGTIKAGATSKSAGDSFVVQGKRPCLEGDEKSVEVPGCVYFTPQYSIPGTGTLKIDQLGPDQIAYNTRVGGKCVLVAGLFFRARFEVQNPAKQPPPGPGAPIPDATPVYFGQGRIITANTTKKTA